MSKGNWCYECGRRIEIDDKICHHCCATQPKGGNYFNTDPSDVQVCCARYDHLMFKQATEKLTDDEEQEVTRLAEYIRNSR